MSTAWTGLNWQLIDPEDTLTMVGVTFGIGLLSEPVEAAGSLSFALSALASELTRPVELGHGSTYVPEGLVELHTDTVSIAIRGSRDAVEAAWRRFPALFTADTVPDGIPPLRPEQPVWPADLLVRTGRNAATLARWQLTAPDALERARLLLTEIDPSVGRIPAVFFTTDESLVGLGFPVRHESSPTASVWADGTPRRNGTSSAAAELNRAGLLPRPEEEDVLCSALVPRSAAGAAAADVLRAQLKATPANGRAGLGIRAVVVGLGAEYCVSLLADRVPKETERRSVLGEFSRTIGLVPDPWIDIAFAGASRMSSPRLERERRLFGLDPVLPPTPADIRHAIAYAADTIHLALDLSAAELDTGSRLNLGGIPADLEPLVGYWEPSFDGAREFRTRRSDDIPETTLVVSRNSIVVPVGGAGNPHGLAVQWDGVDTGRLLARVDDPVGTITLIDESMRTVSFAPSQFPHPDKVLQAVDERIGTIVRLSFLGEVQLPSAPPPAPGRRGRRRRVKPVSARSWVARVLVVGGLAVGSSLLANALAGPAVAAEVTFGDSVTLDNDTDITARAFDVWFPIADEPEYLVMATVDFCAGGDTDAGDVPPETQRTISPDNFTMVNKDGTKGRLIPSDDQLTEVTLESGECVTGEVVFKSATVYAPRIVYTNAVGDKVTWLE